MTDKKILKPFDLQEFIMKMGCDCCLNTPEDYSSIVDDDWYYVLGDGGMKGKDIKNKKIAMHRVKPWQQHKEEQEKFRQFLENEKRKREQAEDEIPF